MYTMAKLRAMVTAMLIRFEPPVIFTDRSKAVLLQLFTISVIVCLCMYILVKVLFWIAVGPFFWERNFPFLLEVS